MSLVIDASQIIEGTWEEVRNHQDKILTPSNRVRVTVTVLQDEEKTEEKNATSIALLESWLADAPKTPEEKEEAERGFKEFKRNMNEPRKIAGARLLYPED
jgi:hypothetical protein